MESRRETSHFFAISKHENKNVLSNTSTSKRLTNETFRFFSLSSLLFAVRITSMLLPVNASKCYVSAVKNSFCILCVLHLHLQSHIYSRFMVRILFMLDTESLFVLFPSLRFFVYSQVQSKRRRVYTSWICLCLCLCVKQHCEAIKQHRKKYKMNWKEV